MIVLVSILTVIDGGACSEPWMNKEDAKMGFTGRQS